MNEDLVSTITSARFTSEFRQGYEMGTVDEFLDRLVAQLSAGGPVKEMIESTRFPVARWREAYNIREVDLLVAMVKHKARVSPSRAAEAPPAAVVPLHVPQPRAEAIVEKKGLLARLFGAS